MTGTNASHLDPEKLEMQKDRTPTINALFNDENGGRVLDDIERMSDSNVMVENIVCTLSNISCDHGLHFELL